MFCFSFFFIFRPWFQDMLWSHLQGYNSNKIFKITSCSKKIKKKRVLKHNSIHKPKTPNFNVPKKLMYVSLPFLNDSQALKEKLTKSLSHLYPYVCFKFVFKNSLTLGSLFKFKDSLPETMRSCVVYKYTCPKCNFGTYIGCTKRLLKTRITSHMDVSHQTGHSRTTKEYSSIRSHATSCKHSIQCDNFKVLSQSPNCHSLLYLESLFIKQHSPSLNNQTTSVTLHIA